MPTKGTGILENDFRCNKNASSGGSTEVYTVKAGDKAALKQAYGGTGMKHPGPTQVYMSKATGGDVKSYVGNGSWFRSSKAFFAAPAMLRLSRMMHGVCTVKIGSSSQCPRPSLRANTSCVPSTLQSTVLTTATLDSTIPAPKSRSKELQQLQLPPPRLRYLAPMRSMIRPLNSALGYQHYLSRPSRP